MVVVKASVVPSVSVVAGTLVVAEVAPDIGAVSVVDDQPDVVLVPTVVLHSVAFDTVVVPNIVAKRIRKNLNQRSGFTYVHAGVISDVRLERRLRVTLGSGCPLN